MSISILKHKAQNSVPRYSKISGKKTDKYWLYAGPYGNENTVSGQIFIDGLKSINRGMMINGLANNSGFSVTGSNRNVGGVGTTYLNSVVRTPFRGIYPVGYGGLRNTYESNRDTIVLNQMVGSTYTESANNSEVVKPPVLSNSGMLSRKYRWAYNGVYPNYVVSSLDYTGNQTESSSYGLYIHNKKSINDCYYNVNNPEVYAKDAIKESEICLSGCDRYGNKRNNGTSIEMLMNQAPYGKTLYQPMTASEYLTKKTKCVLTESAKEQKRKSLAFGIERAMRYEGVCQSL